MQSKNKSKSPKMILTMINPATINKEFKIVFEPKNKSAFNDNRRFGVGAGRLADYIGESNAQSCFEKAMKSTTDKVRFKFRVQGIVDFYVK